jgi:acyl dehydratase
MLILAYVSQMMTAAFGQSWLVGGRLNVRFKGPARPGDTITVNGKICNIDRGDGHTLIRCDVICSNQKDEPVITGETEVRMKSNENSH